MVPPAERAAADRLHDPRPAATHHDRPSLGQPPPGPRPAPAAQAPAATPPPPRCTGSPPAPELCSGPAPDPPSAPGSDPPSHGPGPRPAGRGRPRWCRDGAQVGEELVEEADGAGLVERVVAVAALGGLDTGGAAGVAGAGGDGVAGGVEMVEGAAVALLGDAGAAGVAVVDEDRGRPCRDARRWRGPRCPSGRTWRTGATRSGRARRRGRRRGCPWCRGRRRPAGRARGCTSRRRSGAGPGAGRGPRSRAARPCRPGGARSRRPARRRRPGPARGWSGASTCRVGSTTVTSTSLRAWVFVALGLGHQGHTVVEVQLGHPKLALVEVDGAAVDRRRRPCPVDGADDLAGVGGHDGDRGCRRRCGCRPGRPGCGLTGPQPVPAPPQRPSASRASGRARAPSPPNNRDRRRSGLVGAEQVRREHVGVAGVDQGGLVGAAEQVGGVVQEEGVERVVLADQHGQGRPPWRPARPACCHIEATVPG